MAITDEQFKKWLFDDNKNREILIELSHETGTEYFSRFGYQDGANYYAERLLIPISFGIEIPAENLFRGLHSARIPTIQLRSYNGDLDGLVDLNCKGYDLKVLFGDPSWDKLDFRDFFTGIVQKILPEESGDIQVIVNDLSFYLDRNILINRYVSGQLNEGSLQPIAMGSCFNIPPALIESGQANYPGGKWICNSILDGDIDFNKGVRNVFDDGSPFAKNDGATPPTAGDPVGPGEWRPFIEPAGGSNTGNITGFYLGSSPAGKCTADYIGKVDGSGGTNLGPRNAIFELSRRVTPVVGKPNIVQSMSQGSPLIRDIQLFSDKEKTAREAIDELASSVGAFAYYTRAGDIFWGFIDMPLQNGDVGYSEPELKFTEDDFEANSFDIVDTITPFTNFSLNYFKNWATQDQPGSPAGGFEDRSGRLNQEFLFRENVNGVNQNVRKLAKDFPTWDTLLHGHDYSEDDAGGANWGTDADDVLTEVRRKGIKEIWIMEATVHAGGILAQPGEEIKITHSRFGFENGRSVVVVGYNIDFGDRTTVRLIFADHSNYDRGLTSKDKFGAGAYSGERVQGSTGSDGYIEKTIGGNSDGRRCF